MGVFAFTLLHSLPNLASNPSLSYDEGYILQAPWNLVERGFYGTIDAEESWLFDPHQTTGPALTLPAAAVFAVAGSGVEQARTVSVVYAGLAVAAFYALLRLAGGRSTALLGALLLSLCMYPYNRTFLGEVPGLFWVFVGARLWLDPGTPSRGRMFVAGSCFGVAALCKLALAPVALGALSCVWVISRIRGRRGNAEPVEAPGLVARGALDAGIATAPEQGAGVARGPVYPVRGPGGAHPGLRFELLLPLLGAALPVLLWYGVQAALVGPQGLLDRFAVMADYREQLADASPDRLARNAAAALDALPLGLRVWALPAILLAGIRLISGPPRFAVSAFLLFMTAFGTGYYLFSIGWPRYGFAAVAGLAGLTALLSRVFLDEVVKVVAGATTRGRLAARLYPLPIIVAFSGLPLAGTLSAVSSTEDPAGAAARFLAERMGADERAGTGDWEIDFLAGRRLSHPPTYVATVPAGAARIERMWDGMDWVVIGPIGRVFQADWRLGRIPAFTDVFTSGPYTVYQRQRAEPAGWIWDMAGATRVALSTPVTQEFRAGTRFLDGVRVLLAGDGLSTNATVYVRLYPAGNRPDTLALVNLPGERITENRWYRVPLGKVEVEPGARYAVELSVEMGPGQQAPAAWYTESAEVYPDGRWYLNGRPMEGNLYFGVVGHGR